MHTAQAKGYVSMHLLWLAVGLKQEILQGRRIRGNKSRNTFQHCPSCEVMPDTSQALWGLLSSADSEQCFFFFFTCCLGCVCLHFSLDSREYILFSFVSFSGCTKPASQQVPNMCFVQLKGEQQKQDIWSGVTLVSWHLGKFLRTPKWPLKLCWLGRVES